MQQTLSGRLAAHCGGWTGCEAGCQHQPPWRELRTATIMNKASLQEGQLGYYCFLMNILVIYSTCTTTDKVSKSAWSFEGEHGRRKMQREIEPWPLISSIQTRRAGLNYLPIFPQPSLSLLITFPRECACAHVRACVYTGVFSCERRLREERKMKKEKCMFSRPKCLWWMR